MTKQQDEKVETAKPIERKPISDFALFGMPGSYMQAQRDAARRQFEAEYDRADSNRDEDSYY